MTDMNATPRLPSSIDYARKFEVGRMREVE